MSPDEAEQSASEQPAAPGRGRRRSRRGGRRHSRRREPREPREPREAAQPGAEAPAAAIPESSPPAVEEAERREEPGTESRTPAITDAIEQVNRIIEELKHALDEMEEVLETLELAERQKIDDEREIHTLQRALRQLHRPRESESRH